MEEGERVGNGRIITKTRKPNEATDRIACHRETRLQVSASPVAKASAMRSCIRMGLWGDDTRCMIKLDIVCPVKLQPSYRQDTDIG